MKYDHATSMVTLASGRTFYSYGDHWTPQEGGIQYGSDGGVDTDDWTKAERTEVAEIMIERWQRWLRESNS